MRKGLKHKYVLNIGFSSPLGIGECPWRSKVQVHRDPNEPEWGRQCIPIPAPGGTGSIFKDCTPSHLFPFSDVYSTEQSHV